MTGDLSQLINFVQKFLGTVKFENDHVAKIMGYGEYKIRNTWLQHTCFIRNLDGVDLLTGSRGNNLYTLSQQDMMASSPICLLSKASKTKFWLWNHRLSRLNFGAINQDRSVPEQAPEGFEFIEKDHLCSACTMGRIKKKSHKPKSEDTNQEKLYLLHIDLCGPMRVESVNGKKYILVIVDDYSRFTWVKCLRSKDEASDFIIKFLKMIQVRLKVPVRRIRIDNGNEFVNQMLREYYEQVGISHETSVARSSQQNNVIERRNRTLIEAARTIVDPQAPEVIAPIANVIPPVQAESTGSPSSTTVDQDAPSPSKSQTTPETQSSVIPQAAKEDIHDIKVAHMRNDLSGPALNEMTHATISSGLVQKPSISTPYVPPSRNDWDLLFQPMFDELLNPPPSVDPQAPEVIAPIANVIPPVQAESTGSPSSTTVDQDAPSPSKSQTTPETQSSVIPQAAEEDIHDIKVAHMRNDLLLDLGGGAKGWREKGRRCTVLQTEDKIRAKMDKIKNKRKASKSLESGSTKSKPDQSQKESTGVLENTFMEDVVLMGAFPDEGICSEQDTKINGVNQVWNEAKEMEGPDASFEALTKQTQQAQWADEILV
nr:hypothetical protein [Tanacetum cinerariifolium]